MKFMRKLKRIICLFLLLATLVSVLPVTRAEAAISTETFTEKVNAFLADSRWKHGISWNGSQKPKLSSWSSSGCCAKRTGNKTCCKTGCCHSWHEGCFSDARYDCKRKRCSRRSR